MTSPAEEALNQDTSRKDAVTAVDRYLSGIAVVAPLVSAIVKWDSDDVQETTGRVLDCAKTLIDSVTASLSGTGVRQEMIAELCVTTVAAAWSHDGDCRPEQWVAPITDMLKKVAAGQNREKQTTQEFAKYGSVLCALSSHGLQGENCAIFHGVCDDIATMCDRSLTKLRVMAGPSQDQEEAIRRAIHAAACDLFTSTLEHEHKQYVNESYRASVDPNYKRTPFDMQLFMRRFTLYFEHLCDAIYVNSRQRL